MLKLWVKVWRAGYLHRFTPPIPILINYKGKQSNCFVERPGRQHLHKVIKVSLASNGTNLNQVLLDRTQWEEHSDAPEMSLPKMPSLTPIAKKPELTELLQYNWLRVFEVWLGGHEESLLIPWSWWLCCVIQKNVPAYRKHTLNYSQVTEHHVGISLSSGSGNAKPFILVTSHKFGIISKYEENVKINKVNVYGKPSTVPSAD